MTSSNSLCAGDVTWLIIKLGSKTKILVQITKISKNYANLPQCSQCNESNNRSVRSDKQI